MSFTFRGPRARSTPRARPTQKRAFPAERHLNLAYQVNNSANVLRDLETTPPSQGGRAVGPSSGPFAMVLGISRVDAFEIGLGAEYVNKWIRPYLEWTIEMPVNRQGYVCNVMGAQSRGDQCVSDWPPDSRVRPVASRSAQWAIPGRPRASSSPFAVDIGTGGHLRSSSRRPRQRLPTRCRLGVGYADRRRSAEAAGIEARRAEGDAALALGRVIDEEVRLASW